MEYQSALKTPDIVEPPKKHYRETKYWIRAKRRYNNKSLLMTNSSTEFNYHQLLKEVKTLFAPRGEYLFERDYKTDRNSGLLTMHTLMCESLFLDLWCCFSEYYFVDYHFDNCPFEQEIRQHFSRGMLYTQSRHFPLDKGFFQRKIEQEDEKFFYYLKVETAE